MVVLAEEERAFWKAEYRVLRAVATEAERPLLDALLEQAERGKRINVAAAARAQGTAPNTAAQRLDRLKRRRRNRDPEA